MTMRANREDTLHPTWKRARAPRRLALRLALAAAFPVLATASNPELTALSLEPWLEVTNVGASKYEPKQSEGATGVNVITLREVMVPGRAHAQVEHGQCGLSDAVGMLSATRESGSHGRIDEAHTFFERVRAERECSMLHMCEHLTEAT